MFDMFGQIAGLMKNAHQLQSRSKELKDRLRALLVEAESHDGVVVVVVSGDQKIQSMTLRDHGYGPEELAALISSTVNLALAQARERAASEVADLAKDLGIPGLQQTLNRFGFGTD